MRLCATNVAASVLLLAASVLSLEDINVTVEKGIDFVAAIATEGHDVTHCYLTTPSGKVIDFNPEEKIVNDKYELNINDKTKCSVIIKDLDEDDSGDWVLRYNYGDQTDKQNYHITVSSDIKSNSDRQVQYLTARRFNTVLGATHTILMEVASFSTSETCFLVTPAGVTHTLTASTQIPGVQVVTGSGIECGVTITVTSDNIGEWTLVGWSTFLFQAIERRLPITIYVEGLVTEPEPAKRTLQQIDHVTRAGAIFDISLSRTADQEECFLTTPQGQTFALTAVSISGVTVRSASNYVNCRVTIGPMEPRLIGIWSLCGRRTGDLERCQPANVTWYSDTDPTSEWEINMRPQFDYNVNFGGFVNPSVSGFGELLTCHVITPSGEDLALTGDTDYPGIKRNSLGLPAVCSVEIGPIDSTMLGEWVVYTKVHSPFFGFSEIQLPFTFNLYNKDDPYAQAYNVTKLDPINRVINIGNTITVEVTGTGSVEGCYYTTPTGVTYSSSESNQFDVTFENVGTNVACRAIIGPISETMIGMWEIIGKFSDVGSYTEKHQVVHILIEDPENPMEEDHRRVDILPPQTLNTELGARHTVTIPLYSFTTVQSCHVRTPDGLQYKLMDGFNLPGVVIEHSTTAACAISITVEREDMVGEWMLISRAVVIADAVEQRLSFTIHVEENVEAFPSEITIVEGNDLYVRLSESIDATDSCNLVGPNENIVPDVDTVHENACGFIVRDIGTNGSGEWQIVYGNNVIHRAFINVTVVAKTDLVPEDIVLYKHGAVNQTFGPENSVYCRLRDPRGVTVFEGFGRCNLVIDRVTSEHEGKWTMAAGIMGQVVLDEQEFQVIVINEDSTPVVLTHVEKHRPEVILSCKLSSSEPVKMCKFRDPHGTILLASQGVGQYHYTVLGIEISLESELTSNECGLRITNPTTADLGLWRCAMETESHTYFGFLSVLCPWALQDPEVQAAVTTEPILTADRTEISAIEGDSVTMTCSIQAPIHYCYFRRQNGTTFSVSPGTANAAMEYVGAGFEAGECGVRFKNLIAIDSGSWSCHVGLKNDLEPEQQALFNVIVIPQITLHLGFSGNEVIAEGNISMPGVLEYCRFVRMDGLGFTSQSVPEGFTFVGSLEDKRCAIRIGEPTILNIHPWVIAAKLVGMDVEISGTTTDNLFILPGDQSDDSGHIRVVFLWVIICLLSTLILLLLFTFIPKIDKKWFHDKMSRKQPVQNYTA